MLTWVHLVVMVGFHLTSPTLTLVCKSVVVTITMLSSLLAGLKESIKRDVNSNIS